MQAAGVVNEVLTQVVPGYGSHYYSPTRIRFAKVEPTGQPYGYPKAGRFSPAAAGKKAEGRAWSVRQRRYSQRLAA